MINICGIYGFMGKPSKKTSGIVKTLGELNMERGTDSTGLAFVTRRDGELIKNIVDAELFFKQPDVIRLLCQYRHEDFLTILGHTRAATRGAVISPNAHPFVEKDIIFTHNGVIGNFDELMKKYEVKYEVDSQIIGYLLANKTNIHEINQELGGYFTVPFVDRNQVDCLQVLIRSGMFSFATRNQQLYYSSDIRHLRAAIEGHEGFTIHEGGSNLLYKFYLENNTIVISKEKIKAKEYHSSYSYHNGIYSNTGTSEWEDEWYDKNWYDTYRNGQKGMKKVSSIISTDQFHRKTDDQFAIDEATEKRRAIEASIIGDTEEATTRQLLNKKYYQNKKQRKREKKRNRSLIKNFNFFSR